MALNRKTLTSTRFLVTLATATGVWLTAVAGSASPKLAAYLTTGAIVSYAVGRALTKWGDDLKPGYHTTEFWVAAANVLVAGVYALDGALPTKVFATVTAVLGGALALLRAISAPGGFPVTNWSNGTVVPDPQQPVPPQTSQAVAPAPRAPRRTKK